MAYDEWHKAKQDRLQHLWRKPACWRAFEALAHCGVVRFVSDKCAAGRPALHRRPAFHMPACLSRACPPSPARFRTPPPTASPASSCARPPTHPHTQPPAAGRRRAAC
jgi:hypothetical protein